MADDEVPRKSNLVIVGGDGDASAIARQRMPLAAPANPCHTCGSWEQDRVKLVRHFVARGLKIKNDGTVYSPIHADFGAARVGMTINANDFGYCRFWMMPSENLHTCPSWVPRSKRAAR